jgi:hypothetical protein
MNPIPSLMRPEPTDETDAMRRAQFAAIVYGMIAIAVFQCGLGLYAAALNKLFYAKFGPFYDSMSYLNRLAELQSTAQAKGRFAAFLEASFHSTVVYPWLLFAPFAKSAAMARTNGVWIQVVAAATMQFMLFLYFFRTRSLPLVQAVAFSTVFSVIASFFHFNGGLADFRMDLLQYLVMTTVMAAYFIARQSSGILWWFLLGCFTGLLCLARATSPVYIVPIFAILAGADLALDFRDWRRIVGRWGVTAVVTVVVSGWYFVANFEHLHFYYFIWNQDANARLPLATSVRHVGFVREHIGAPLLRALVVTAIVTLFAIVLQQGRDALRRVNWRALIFSAVPVGYLVLSGAGLNQFVSIVGAAGIIMFLLDPIAGARPRFAPFPSLIIIAALALACFGNASRGIANHSRDDVVSAYIPRHDGLSKIVELMTANARRDGMRRVYTYAVAHIGSIDGTALVNALLYDYGFQPTAGMIAVRDGVRLRRVDLGTSVATAVEWSRAHGRTDDEKIALAVSRLAEGADFLLVATDDSELPDHVFVTHLIPKLRAALLSSGNWVQTGEPIRVSGTERVLFLINKKRMGAS